MRAAEWEFADREHVVYQRGKEARWPVPLPGMEAVPYEVERAPAHKGDVIEPLRMETLGYPSTVVYRGPGGDTLQKVDLRSEHAQDMDMAEVERIARDEWMALLRDMSLGPYTLKVLRTMGNPYGYGARGETPSWERLRRPRKVPSMGPSAHLRGLRGRVPDRSIINMQSGAFSHAWRFALLRWYGGATLLFTNPMFYAWFLAHGTYKMQAHGPWATVAQRLLPKVFSAWSRAAATAWRRGAQKARLQVAAFEGQFGEGAEAAAAVQSEAGGWA